MFDAEGISFSKDCDMSMDLLLLKIQKSKMNLRRFFIPVLEILKSDNDNAMHKPILLDVLFRFRFGRTTDCVRKKPYKVKFVPFNFIDERLRYNHLTEEVKNHVGHFHPLLVTTLYGNPFG